MLSISFDIKQLKLNSSTRSDIQLSFIIVIDDKIT